MNNYERKNSGWVKKATDAICSDSINSTYVSETDIHRLWHIGLIFYCVYAALIFYQCT